MKENQINGNGREPIVDSTIAVKAAFTRLTARLIGSCRKTAHSCSLRMDIAISSVGTMPDLTRRREQAGPLWKMQYVHYEPQDSSVRYIVKFFASFDPWFQTAISCFVGRLLDAALTLA